LIQRKAGFAGFASFSSFYPGDSRRNQDTERGRMPYRVNVDLPASAHHLPGHAPNIYREACSNACAAHASETGRERRVQTNAWAAVKRCCVKERDMWVERRA
jgi:cation transport regulator ChaB